MAGGEADALHAGDLVHIVQQQGKVGDFAVVHQAAIGVDVLAQQGDFFHPLLRQAGDFHQHIVQRTRDFFATGIGHHAEGAVFRAAFHDGDKRRAAFHPRWRQMVEFFDFREGNIHLGAAAVAARAQHVRQAVQGLRAKHHIDKGRAFDNRLALLTGHATAHANHQIRALQLELAHAAQVGKHFFLGFFAHRTGVEQNDVGVFRGVGADSAFAGPQHIQHFGRVILVHLAAEGFDKDFLAHGNPSG